MDKNTTDSDGNFFVSGVANDDVGIISYGGKIDPVLKIYHRCDHPGIAVLDWVWFSV